jgi:ABC-2 type transport system ATP-binding protein
MAGGRIVDSGPTEQVRGSGTLEERFVELVGGGTAGERGLSWLAS